MFWHSEKQAADAAIIKEKERILKDRERERVEKIKNWDGKVVSIFRLIPHNMAVAHNSGFDHFIIAGLPQEDFYTLTCSSFVTCDTFTDYLTKELQHIGLSVSNRNTGTENVLRVSF